MNQRLLLRSKACLIFISLWGLNTLSQAAEAQIVRNRLPLVTKQSSQADRLYFSLQQTIQQGQRESLAEQVEELRRQYSNYFVDVSSHRQVEASYLSDLVSFQVGINTVEFSSETLTADSSLLQLYRAALRGRITAENLIEMGDQLWSDGKLEKAQQTWLIAQSLLSNRDSSPQRQNLQNSDLVVELYKRGIVANIFTGRFRSAQRQIEQLNSEYPEVVSRVAGQSGPLAEILTELTHSLDRSNAAEFVQVGPTLPFQVHRYDLLHKRWQSPLSLTNGKRVADVQVWKDVVIVHDQAGIRALNNKTGQSAWPAGENDSGLIFETEPSDDSEVSLLTGQSIIHENVLYVRTGVKHFAEKQNRSITQEPRLSALDLNAEGRLEWTVTSQDCFTETSNEQVIFSGPSVLSEEHLIIPMRSASPGNRLLLASLNKRSGQTVWTNSIAASFSPYQPGVADQLVADGERIYWLVDGHVLICINSRTGNGLWFSSINEVPVIRNNEEQRSRQLLVVDDVVLCAANSGPAAFNKYTGEELWSQPMESTPTQLVGSCDDVVVFANPGLYGFDLYTGRLLWNHHLAAKPQEIQFTLLGRSAIFAASNSLLTLDVLSGSILQQDDTPLRQESEIRSLLLNDNTLFLQQNQELFGVEVFRTVN